MLIVKPTQSQHNSPPVHIEIKVDVCALLKFYITLSCH